MNRRASIALGFLGLILLGAVLLYLPVSQTTGTYGKILPSLFMSTSAVCVTGLSVADLARDYTLFGQVTLLVLVQIGCLGLMTCGTFLLIAIGRRLSLSREFSLMNAYGVEQVRGLKSLIAWVIISMLVLEGLGAFALSFRLPNWYESVFYAVMGFCNAGFSLSADSIAAFAGDPYILLTLAAETILGGLGFLVLYNICSFRFSKRLSGVRGRLTLHTRVVLKMTAILLLLAFVVFLLLEWNGALKAFPPLRKLLVGFYQAVTPRTCGFTVVAMEGLKPVTRLFTEALMFIGGAPGSAAAGLKVTTLVVLVATLTAMCRGETETTISKRAVPMEIVREAIVIFMAMVAFSLLVFGALLMTEDLAHVSSDALFFETVSAVTTTGLSIGETTKNLSNAGLVVIMFAMFFGRLGALSVVLMIGDRESKRHVRYPSEELVVG